MPPPTSHAIAIWNHGRRISFPISPYRVDGSRPTTFSCCLRRSARCSGWRGGAGTVNMREPSRTPGHLSSPYRGAATMLGSRLRFQPGLRLLIAAAGLAGWAVAAQADPLAPENAVKHQGETVTVCGQVAGAKYAA